MDPQRFDQGDATEFERRLFEAAQRQAPSAVLRARMQQGLGLAAAPAAVPVVAKSVALSWKLGALLGLAAIGTVATVSLIETKGRQTLSAEMSPAASRPASAMDESTKPNRVVPSENKEGIENNEDSSFMAEIHLLDRARTVLSGGDPRRALDVLDQYDKQHAQGRFGPEAIALRIQALVAAGDAQSAGALGRKFLADYPTNPLAARVAKLIRR